MPALRCAKCASENPPDTRFCGACGATMGADVAAPSPGAQPVCAGCGVVAPVESSRCERCSAALNPRAPMTVPRPDGAVWAFVECVAACPGCRAALPLRPGDVGAPVACGRCGQQATVELSEWQEALGFAHAVGDLAGPDPQGRNVAIARQNPHGLVGVKQTFASLTPSGARPLLRVKATAGHPLCPRCRAPLDVRVAAPGRAATACAGCGDRDMYVTPDGLRRVAPAVLAVLAPADDTDAWRVHEWWALFQGAAPLRRALEEQAARHAQEAERARREREAREEAERRAREEAERRAREEQAAREEAARQEMARQEAMFRANAEAQARRERELQEAREKRLRLILIAVLLVGITAATVIAVTLLRQRGAA